MPPSGDLTPATIKAARLRLGLTQAQFAARIGASPLAVSFWERGTRRPTGLYAVAVRKLIAEGDAITPPPTVEPPSTARR